jgi:hypothetical protein
VSLRATSETMLIAEASASSISVIPDFSASSARSSTMSSLRWFAGVLMSKRAPGRAADAGVPADGLKLLASWAATRTADNTSTQHRPRDARYRRAVKARGHFPSEQAALNASTS